MIAAGAIDWAGWALFGLVATAALTAILMGAQLAGRTRMDLPLMLGTIVVANPDRARIAGTIMHLIIGQGFALGYAASFALIGEANALLGAGLGLLHGLIALLLIVALLPGVHPRMATTRAGPDPVIGLEPPGPLAANYGRETVWVTIAAHVAFGVALGLLLTP
jgi:hypothetical protein